MGNTHQKPITKQGKLLSEVSGQMKPFDLVFFKGDDFVSSFISRIEKRGHRTAKGGNFTHVGMIVNDQILDDSGLTAGKLYVLESVISGKLGYGVKDINGRSFLGVQIRDLEELLVAYDHPNDTAIAWCPLINNPCNSENVKQRFTQIYRDVYGIMWDANCWSLFSALYPRMRPLRPLIEKLLRTDRWLFCSELMANILRDFAVLPSTVDPKDVIPADLVYPEEDTDPMPKIVSDVVYIISPLHAATDTATAAAAAAAGGKDVME